MKKRYFLLIATIGLIFILSSCNTQKGVPPVNEAELIHLLNERLTVAIMEDGFTPPVAARIYAYSNVGAYEAIRLSNSNYRSLSGQLNGLKQLPNVPRRQKVDYRVVLVSVFTEVANSIIYRDSILQNLRDSLNDIYAASGISKEVMNNSLKYGVNLGQAIIQWSAKDGYAETRKMPVFTPLDKPGEWEPTPPKYLDAIEPYWGALRTFVLDSSAQFATPFNTPFDTLKNSKFYAMCTEEYDSASHLDSTKMLIARFWDDNPLIILSKGHTMLNYRQITPGGHWINITKIVSRQKKLTLQQSCDIYMRVSLSLADAFIACWHIKYNEALLRPVSYINQYIDASWKPLIETPPFPEYTCGHSTISAAAAQTLAIYFGDHIGFVDDTNDPYDLPIRSFDSFLAASEEAGRSRMYGGIHFHQSCTTGRNQGLSIGQYIAKKVVSVPFLK